MPYGFFKIKTPENEPTLSYLKGSTEREEVISTYRNMYESQVNVPLYLGNEEVFTQKRKSITPPHDHQHVVGSYSLAEKSHVSQAINCSLEARNKWADMDWEHRISVFLKAAELISGPYRAKINAGTMIGQSKNIFQAEPPIHTAT